LSAVGNVLRASVLETPPNVVEGSAFAAITELLKAGRIANRIRSVGLDLQRDFLDLFAASAGDFLDSWFESAPIKAAFGFDSVVGNYASPYTSGSAYVLLHHSFGEVNGKRGVWGHAIGGMGAITQAMAKSATAHGVTIRLSTRVRRVLIENGQAIGVETDKGESVRAIAVAAGINPKLLYLHLVEARALPEGFRR
jgi:phytoene dehydrogenase-like protein